MDCKKILLENIERELVPLRVMRKEIEEHPTIVRAALGDGAAKARRIARETMDEVRRAMGLGSGAVVP
jgi:tryptophanyl-tRNA synthetase